MLFTAFFLLIFLYLVHPRNAVPAEDCTFWKAVPAGKDKNIINPLERMEGCAHAVMLPLWSYKSELLTPKPKA